MDKELAGWPQTEGCGQQLCVQMETSNEHWPPGVFLENGTLKNLKNQ